MATTTVQSLTNLGNITDGVTIVGEAVPGTTGKFTISSTGSGSVVLSTSPTLTTPVLGTPTSGTLTNCTGLPISTGVSGLGTGVATVLATPSSANLASAITDETGSGALVFATSPTLVTPVLGTPASGTLTNCTGLPISTGVSGLGTGVATVLATPSSANLASAITDETGSGALVFANTPTLVTPVLGTPNSGTLTNCTGLPVSTGVSGLGTGVATFLGTPSSANLASALTDETGSGAAVFATSPTLVTPILGTPTSGTLTNCTGLPISSGVSGLAAGAATFLATPSSANLASLLTDETGSGANVHATSPTLVTPILGTPTSGTLTNCTGLPVSTGISGLGTGVGTFLATPSSANLASAVTDETGSGALVFATSPTLVTPALGTPASGALTNCTSIPVANATGTLAVANGGTGVTANVYYCARRSGAQSISDITFTKVQNDTEVVDSNSNYDNVTNYRFTPTVAGTYLFAANLDYDTMVDQKVIRIYLYKNGSSVAESGTSSSGTAQQGCTLLNIQSANGSTDYFEMYVWQNTGGSINLNNNTFITGHRIGA